MSGDGDGLPRVHEGGEGNDDPPDEDVFDRLRQRWHSLRNAGDVLRSGGDAAADTGGDVLTRARAYLATMDRTQQGILVGGALFAVLAYLLGLMTVLFYVGIFAAGALLIPGVIYLFAPSMKASRRTPLGDLNLVLMQLASGGSAFVQRARGGWERCRFDGERVKVDGDWRALEAGFEYVSRLGWKPFAIIYEGDDEDAFRDVRVDARNTVSDGGYDPSGGVRANYREHPVPVVDDSKFLVDMKRVIRGYQGAGGPDVLRRPEQQELKTQAGLIALENAKWAAIASLGGILTGGLMAYLIFGS